MIAMVLMAALATAAPMTTADMLKLGEALAQRGDGKKAQVQLEKVLADPALAPKDKARAEQALGLALLQQKKTADALPHLEAAATLAPTSEKAWLYLGLARDQANDAKGSLEAYKKGVAALPKSIALQHELGMALLAAGKNDEGADVLAKASAHAEQDGELMADAAYALTLVGKFKDAREHAARAVEMSPDSPDALFVLGSGEECLGNLMESKQAFLDAVESYETHVPALFQLGLLLQQQKDDAGAVARFTRILQVEPDHVRARAALGASLARLGSDDKRAEELLTSTLRVDPKYATGHALLAEVYARQGKWKEAKKELKTATKLKPDDAEFKQRLGEIDVELKKKR
jgi:tetratricopeptide (TPR) repeat protein